MRKRKSVTLAQLPTQVSSNGFVNRRSTVQSRPPAPGSTNQEKLSKGRAFVADAMAAGISGLGAHRLLRSIRELARASGNGTLDDATVRARAEALALGAS